MINNIDELRTEVVNGRTDFKDESEVYTQVHGDLILFKYLPTCAFKNANEWTWLERVSRGLIMDRKTGEVVARPYDKFFNYGQDTLESNKISHVSEKADGSLGILYRMAGDYQFATNGSLKSDQAVEATRMWNERLSHIKVPEDWTLLCEIIYPTNRIVVDYGDWSGFIVLDARNRVSGEYVSRSELNAWFGNQTDMDDRKHIRMVYPNEKLTTIESLLEWCKNNSAPTEHEGWVVVMDNGQRVKFKSEDYLRVHRLVSNITEKNIWLAMCDDRAEEFRETIPNEFVNIYDRIYELIWSRVEGIRWNTLRAYDYYVTILNANHGRDNWTQKDFAMNVKSDVLSMFIFSYANYEADGANDRLRKKILDNYMKMVKKWNWFDPIDNLSELEE